MSTGSPRIFFRCKPELFERAAYQAGQLGVSINDLGRIALVSYLALAEKANGPAPPGEGVRGVLPSPAGR